jgi:hypothetical protein
MEQQVRNAVMSGRPGYVEDESERLEREERERQRRLQEEQERQEREQREREEREERERLLKEQQEREEQERQQLLESSSSVQLEIIEFVGSLGYNNKLRSKFETGKMTSVKAIALFEKKGREQFDEMLESTYGLDPDEAMDFVPLIGQLKELREQLGSHFEELPFEGGSSPNPISSSTPSPSVQPPFHSPSSSTQSPFHAPSSSMGSPMMHSGRHLAPTVMINNIFEVTESELEKLHHSGTGKGTHILRAYDTYMSKEIILKAFEDKASAVREHTNLDKLRSRHVVSVFGSVIQIEHGDAVFYGVAMERGEEDLRDYITKFPDLTGSERKDIGEKIIKILQYMQKDCGAVWHDLKPSNFVRCYIDGRNMIKAIDVEHCLDEGTSMSADHGHTVRFAPPEVVRGTEGMKSSSSMDMWSLGVTLLFVAKGVDIADLLFPEDPGEEGTGRLSRLYTRESDDDIQNQIDSVLDQTFTTHETHVKSLIGHLLKVDPGKRYSVLDVLSHSYVVGGRGTTTKKEVKLSDKMDKMIKGQEEVKEALEEQTLSIEFMREEQG